MLSIFAYDGVLCPIFYFFVLYDFYSVFGNNRDYVITRAENLILQISKEEANNYTNNYVINK